MNNFNDEEKRTDGLSSGNDAENKAKDISAEEKGSVSDFYSEEYERKMSGNAERNRYEGNSAGVGNDSANRRNDGGNANDNPYGEAYNNPYGGAYNNPYGGRNNNYNNGYRGTYYTNPENLGRGKAVYDRTQAESVKKRERSKIITGIVFALLIFLAFVIGMSCSGSMNRSSMYNEIMDKIRNNYLFEYDEEKLDYYAGLGISTQLDAYSRILDPYEFYELINATDSEMFGFGYSLSADNKWTVTTVLTDSPMDYAVSADGTTVGLMEGDELVSVNNTSVSGKTKEELISLLDTDKITRLVINRNGRTITFNDIVRRLVRARYVEYFFVGQNGEISTNMKYYFEENGVVYTDMDNGQGNVNIYPDKITDPECYPHYRKYELEILKNADNVGYIKLDQFSYTEEEMVSMKTTDFDAAMNAFRQAYGGKGKLILDLRGNPGGYNNYCLSVASYLTYNGNSGENLRIYRMVDKNGNEVSGTQTSIRTKYDQYFDVNAEGEQIVVLTSGGSASASEMLTGAVLTYGTAIQVGRQTYGKGISQTVEPIKYVNIEVDGQRVRSAYAFYYTFAYFYTPDVKGSTSKYNNYCNQSDRNGDGVIGEGEKAMGFEPEVENLADGLYDCLARAVQLLGR